MAEGFTETVAFLVFLILGNVIVPVHAARINQRDLLQSSQDVHAEGVVPTTLDHLLIRALPSGQVVGSY
jgi:hypothetical protein